MAGAVPVRLDGPGRWKIDAERRAASGRAFHFDASVMSAHDAQRRRQAQAAAGELGGEKRVEDAGHGLRIHARAVVFHFETHIPARTYFGRSDYAWNVFIMHLADARGNDHCA